jgi:hypothetical protein
MVRLCGNGRAETEHWDELLIERLINKKQTRLKTNKNKLKTQIIICSCST